MALSGSTNKTYSPSEAFWVWVEWTATQNTANNTSTITAITYGGSNSYGYYNGTNKWGYTTIDGTTTSVKYTAPWAASTTKKELHRQVKTVTHNSDGSKTLTISGKWTAGSDPEGSFFNLTSSGSFTLDTIARASTPTLSASGLELGSILTVTTNRASTDFTHTLKYALGSQTGTIATGITTSHAWTLPASLANAIPNSPSGVVTLTLETYQGATLIGTKTATFTAVVPNNDTYRPTATISSVVEGATGLSAFTVFVQSKSKLTVTSTGSGKNGATISQYKVTIDGLNYYGASITSGVINKSGDITISLTVTDSRGYSRTVSVVRNIVAYAPPKILAFDAKRSPNEQGTNLSAPVNFSISPVSNQNTKSYTLRYRQTGQSWTTLSTSTSAYVLNTTLTGSNILNANNSYEVELIVADYFTSVSRLIEIGTAFVLLDFNASGKGFAIGKVSQSDSFEVAIPTIISQPMSLDGVDLDLVGGKLKHNGVERPYDYLIPSGTDLNTLQTTGTYYCPANATVATLGNTPQTNAFSLIVTKHAGVSQIMIPYPNTSHDFWHRNLYNGVWGSWGKILPASGGSMTAAEILTALKTVDGAGSGLDADLLDGLSSASFLRITASSGDRLNGYEKYSNGMARAWKTYTGTILATALSATGPAGTYKSAWLAFGNWPVTFTSYPRIKIDLTVPAGSWVWLGGVKPATTTAPGDFFMYKFGTTDSQIEVYVEGHGPA